MGDVCCCMILMIDESLMLISCSFFTLNSYHDEVVGLMLFLLKLHELFGRIIIFHEFGLNVHNLLICWWNCMIMFSWVDFWLWVCEIVMIMMCLWDLRCCCWVVDENGFVCSWVIKMWNWCFKLILVLFWSILSVGNVSKCFGVVLDQKWGFWGEIGPSPSVFCWKSGFGRAMLA